MPELPTSLTLEDELERHFGFAAFRAGQREVVESVVEGVSVLAVMPTGAGKSLGYQLPACIVGGLTVVVSPLIALMQDQVEQAQRRGLAATCIHSGIAAAEQRRRLEEVRRGEVRLLYVAPERFSNASFMEVVGQVGVSRLAVDEAHCISQWGHDFRPDYRNLGEVRRRLGHPVTLALTATATPEVRQDILVQLGLEEARVVVSGFERPNLFFEVEVVRSDEERKTRLCEVLSEARDQATVVYCSTRRQVDEVCARVHQEGHVVQGYHAGLSDERRATIQDGFMAGDIPVLVATNAFGMGVDKSDVRLVVHYGIPGSLEAYYQEAGRAGRDGEPGRCLLLFTLKDRRIHEFFLDCSHPASEVVMSVWTEVRRYGLGSHALGPQTLADHLNRSQRQGKDRLHEGAVEAALRVLERAAHLTFGWRDGFPWVEVHDLARVRDLRVDWDELSLRREVSLRQLEDVVRYASLPGCRQAHLLRHFRSEASFQGGCDHCDQCCGPVAWHLLKAEGRARPEDALDTVVRKALSGVARARGRGDRASVIAMLRGSRSRLVTARGWESISTHGVLGGWTPHQVSELLRGCERVRLVERRGRGGSGLALTPSGVEVMKGERPIPASLEQWLERRWGL